MDKTYQPFEIEQRWYQFWEQNNCFAPKGHGEPYCIMIPPPNVTGSLHMGHGFQQTLMDALVRYHRMRGFNTFWQVGTDHAGISTQMVVERHIAKEGKTRAELGRENFLKRVWEWKDEYGMRITQQMRRLGISVDWAQERFTLDDDLNHAVQEVFIRLYDEGLIYRGQKLVNWDPHFRSAISDLEVNSVEEDGFLWHIRYPLSDGSGQIIVATTRPETMLGDAAVAVHPDDERYRHMIGKTILLPLSNREIPIIADDYVDMTFGTGCVKITPAHDFNDYEMGQRHQLPLINIFTPEAKINENAPKAYQAMDRFEARKEVVKDLEALNLLEKIEPHKLKVPRADRGNTVVEPYLTDQWFVRMQSLAEKAVAVVEDGQIQYVPDSWSKIYYQWLNNIQDWCISRQLWWGHRIPAWYDAKGNMYVAHDETEVRTKYKLASDLELHQDEDVLDTWFSSALWPFATLGWPKDTPEFKTFYPTSVLITGFDIIFFWVARMTMMGLKFTGKIPFHEVYITGLIRDSEGQKMSKTKGNVLDPIDLIDGIELEALVAKRTQDLLQPKIAQGIEKATRKEFPDGIQPSGTDALRFTYCALATTGRDIRFDLNRLEGYRNFCNKIWYATRFVLMNLEGKDFKTGPVEYSLADRYIRSALQETIQKVHGYFKTYRFDLIAQTLYEFTWNEFCDWYLELSKPLLTSASSKPEEIRGTCQTLIFVLEQVLLLLHPMMPFITEEIWQQIKPFTGKTGTTIMVEPYPEYDAAQRDETIEAEVNWLKSFIIGIRTIRSEMNIAPGKKIPLLLHKGNTEDQKRVAANDHFLKTLAKLESIDWISSDIPPSATALVGNLELLIPLADLIDVDAELKRLHKELEKIERDLGKSQQRLENPSYIANAPAEVVAKERSAVAELQQAREKLLEKSKQIKELA